MALATWWQGDALPTLTELTGLEIELASNNEQLAVLNKLSVSEVRRRRLAGHKPYIASVGGVPVAYGWVATNDAEIGELDLLFNIPVNNRYLWDFATHPEWQGYGIYPRLLQAIIQHEEAEHYWIIYAPENLPSGAGIEKAGFSNVGQLSFRRDGSIGIAPFNSDDRASLGAALLNVPLLSEELSPCWQCMKRVVCTCQINPESCTCAVPVRRSQPMSFGLESPVVN